MFHAFSNLQQRVIASILITLCFLGSIYVSHDAGWHYSFLLLITGATVCAVWEYYKMAEAKGYQPRVKVGLVATAGYLFAVYFQTQTSEVSLLPIAVIGLALLVSFFYYFYKGNAPFVNLAITTFALFYITIPLSYLIEINYLKLPDFINDGRYCLLYLLLLTKATDMAAFFIGKWIGKTPFSPYISPKKTWEGAIGGFVTTVIVGVLLSLFFRFCFETPPMLLSFAQTLLLPMGISIMGQLGDLAESLLKRDAGIKDSSTHLPGLGGVLDLVDSLMFTAPFYGIIIKSWI